MHVSFDSRVICKPPYVRDVLHKNMERARLSGLWTDSVCSFSACSLPFLFSGPVMCQYNAERRAREMLSIWERCEHLSICLHHSSECGFLGHLERRVLIDFSKSQHSLMSVNFWLVSDTLMDKGEEKKSLSLTHSLSTHNLFSSLSLSLFFLFLIAENFSCVRRFVAAKGERDLIIKKNFPLATTPSLAHFQGQWQYMTEGKEAAIVTNFYFNNFHLKYFFFFAIFNEYTKGENFLLSLSARSENEKKNNKVMREAFPPTHTNEARRALCASTGILIFRDWIALTSLPTSLRSLVVTPLNVYFLLMWESFLSRWATLSARHSVSVLVNFIRWKHKIHFYVLLLPFSRPIKKENVNLNSK